MNKFPTAADSFALTHSRNHNLNLEGFTSYVFDQITSQAFRGKGNTSIFVNGTYLSFIPQVNILLNELGYETEQHYFHNSSELVVRWHDPKVSSV